MARHSSDRFRSAITIMYFSVRSEKRKDVHGNHFFPKLNHCFWADVCTSTERLRLFAHLERKTWAASVYDMRTKSWLMESGLAKDAEDAKRQAERTARHQFAGIQEIEWRRLGPA